MTQRMWNSTRNTRPTKKTLMRRLAVHERAHLLRRRTEHHRGQCRGAGERKAREHCNRRREHKVEVLCRRLGRGDDQHPAPCAKAEHGYDYRRSGHHAG